MIRVKKDKKIPYSFYLWLQIKLHERSTKGAIKRTQAQAYFHKYRIPKQLWALIIKEMEVLRLIKFLGRDNIKIINISKNYVENPGKLRAKFGLL